MAFTVPGPVRARLTATNRANNYDDLDIDVVNEVFEFCEDIEEGNHWTEEGLPARIRDSLPEAHRSPWSTSRCRDRILDLAHQSSSIWRVGFIHHDDSVHSIYHYVADIDSGRTTGTLPPTRVQTLSVIVNFTRNLRERAFGGGRGAWHDVRTTTNQVIVPAARHASESLVGLWRNPPRVERTTTLYRVLPATVQPHYGQFRGAVQTTYQSSAGAESLLRNVTAAARFTYITTRLIRIFGMIRDIVRLDESSARWRNTLAQFRDDPTPENLVAYGISAGAMVDDISSLVNARPSGIPFYSSIFEGAGNVATNLVNLLGQRLCRINGVLQDAEQEGGAATERGV